VSFPSIALHPAVRAAPRTSDSVRQVRFIVRFPVSALPFERPGSPSPSRRPAAHSRPRFMTPESSPKPRTGATGVRGRTLVKLIGFSMRRQYQSKIEGETSVYVRASPISAWLHSSDLSGSADATGGHPMLNRAVAARRGEG
jgi:hypothetical protein